MIPVTLRQNIMDITSRQIPHDEQPLSCEKPGKKQCFTPKVKIFETMIRLQAAVTFFLFTL